MGQQMIEERYYTYHQIGNLVSFRHYYPSAGSGRGVFAVGSSSAAIRSTKRRSEEGDERNSGGQGCEVSLAAFDTHQTLRSCLKNQG